MPPLGQFDLAIVKALRKNPQGLRYSELLRKSGEEYRRTSGDDKGINVKTFDKHLKRLVSERALERIEEKRFKVFYRLMIPEESVPKIFVERYRDWYVPMILDLAKSWTKVEYSEAYVEIIVDLLAIKLVRRSLSEAIRLYQTNPVWARYLIDESIESTRKLFNEIAAILGAGEGARGNIQQILNKLELKWSKQHDTRLRTLTRRERARLGMHESEMKHIPSNTDFIIDLSKRTEPTFECPRCRMLISPDDDKQESYSIIGTEMKGNCLKALGLKCQGCGAIIRLEGFD